MRELSCTNPKPWGTNDNLNDSDEEPGENDEKLFERDQVFMVKSVLS